MAALTATKLTKQLPLGDRVVQVFSATSGSGASAADEYINTGLSKIDAVLGVTLTGTAATANVAPVAATATILCNAADPSDGDTITVNGIVYEIEGGTIDANGFDIDLDTTPATQAANIAAAINDAGTRGTTYSAGTPAHPSVSASVNSATVTLTARAPGTVGNALTLAVSNATAFTISGATFSGGLDGKAGVNFVLNAAGTGQTAGTSMGLLGLEFSAASVPFQVAVLGHP